MNKLSHILVVVALVVTGAVTAATALADTPTFPNDGGKSKDPNWPPKKYKGPSPDNKYFKSSKLKDAPNFAGVPEYRSKLKFVEGLAYPPKDGETTYNVRFMAKDKPEEVRDFYSYALTSAGWQIPASGQSANSIVAFDRQNGRQLHSFSMTCAGVSRSRRMASSRQAATS